MRYIGTHTLVELLAAGHEVFVVDNLCNSRAVVIDRIATIAGRRPGFAELDTRDRDGLRKLFSNHSFDAVLHFDEMRAVKPMREPRRELQTRGQIEIVPVD